MHYFFYFADFLLEDFFMFSADCFVWLGDWFPLHFLHSWTVNYWLHWNVGITTVTVFITCGPMWLLSSGCLLEERTGRRCETLKVSERLIRTRRYRQVGFFLFTAAFFPLKYVRIDLKEIWNTVLLFSGKIPVSILCFCLNREFRIVP